MAVGLKLPNLVATKRLFDKSVVDEVSPALEDLLREGVIQEATDNICIVSNLLPVAKPTSTYCLKSKMINKFCSKDV